jgi:Ca-activated chloride channel family protein
MKRIALFTLVSAVALTMSCKEAPGSGPATPSAAGDATTSGQLAQGGERKARPDVPPMPMLKPGQDPATVLGPPASETDLGEPESVSADVSEIARTVMTDPGDIPRLSVEQDGKKLELPLEHTQVHAELTGFVARVTVTQTYQNPFPEPIEAIYVFPLPENSAVDDMKIRIGERLIEAEIKKREEARRVYEEAKREGYTAALLEQERPNIFTQSVANIEPGKKIDVVIRYVQDLSYDAGLYEFVFPMVVGPRYIPGTEGDSAQGTGWSKDTDQVPDASRITPPIIGGGLRSGHDIDIEVVVDRSMPVMDLEVPTHEIEVNEVDGDFLVGLAEHDRIPNRDFVMRYRVDKPEPAASLVAHKDKRGGFFSLVLQPPTADIDKVVGRRELVFVVDISGSMWGVPISMCKAAMQEAITNLRPTDVFNVLTFAGRTAKAFEGSRPANQTNVRLALDFIMNSQAGGGTNLSDAVQTALSPDVADGRDRYVFFLTDGYVGNEQQIHSMAAAFTQAQADAGRRSKVFAMGVGSSVNRHLLDGLADAGRGLTVYATNREDPARAVNKFYHYVDSPVLTDVRVEWGGAVVEDVYPKEIPDLFASRPLILHGRYKAGGPANIAIVGKRGSEEVRIPVEVTFPELEKANESLETLWARARIDELEKALWFGQDQQVTDDITALGIDYRIVTAYTSFVAVDRTKKVGDGDPTTVVQPVEVPEGVDPGMAAPKKAMLRTRAPSGAFNGGTGYGGGGAVGLMGRAESKPSAAPATVAPMPMEAAAADPAPEKEDEADKTAPSVRITSVKVVEGPLTEAKARALVMKHLAALRACHASTQGGGLSAGTMRLEITVEGGKLTNVTVVSSPLPAPLGACAVSKLKGKSDAAAGDKASRFVVELQFG